MDFGTRRVAVVGLRWLVREMKRNNNAFYDAETNAKLVGQARFRIEGQLFWITTHHTLLLYLYSDLRYLGTSRPCRCNRETAHGNIKHLHEAGSSFGRGR